MDLIYNGLAISPAMTDDTYRTICHTCGEEYTSHSLERAKRVFRRHSERGHRVEARDVILSRIDQADGTSKPEFW